MESTASNDDRVWTETLKNMLLAYESCSDDENITKGPGFLCETADEPACYLKTILSTSTDSDTSSDGGHEAPLVSQENCSLPEIRTTKLLKRRKDRRRASVSDKSDESYARSLRNQCSTVDYLPPCDDEKTEERKIKQGRKKHRRKQPSAKSKRGSRSTPQVEKQRSDEPKDERTAFHELITNLLKKDKADYNVKQKKLFTDTKCVIRSTHNDFLWLELQAWHADLSPEDAIEVLQEQREKINDVTEEILNYRFDPSISSADLETSIELNNREAFPSPVSDTPWMFPLPGFETPSHSPDVNKMTEKAEDFQLLEGVIKGPENNCDGCQSVLCHLCVLKQSKALYEVGVLLDKLQLTYDLYPSGRALSASVPLYGSPEFANRLKVMSSWYNITKNLRIKSEIVANILFNLGSSRLGWPIWPAWPVTIDHEEEDQEEEDPEQGVEDIPAAEQDEAQPAVLSQDLGDLFSLETADALPQDRNSFPEMQETQITSDSQTTPEPTKGSCFRKSYKRQTSRVHFALGDSEEGTSYSNEADSGKDSTMLSAEMPSLTLSLPTSLDEPKPNESVNSLRSDSPRSIDNSYSSVQSNDSLTSGVELDKIKELETVEGRLVYRSYVEKALKTKGLRKMLRWLAIVHRATMQRAKKALQMPVNLSLSQMNSFQSKLDPCSPAVEVFSLHFPGKESIDTHLSKQQLLLDHHEDEIYELERYGTWSPEFQSLNLPSYRGLYLFLSHVPLDVIHECLCIRLEQKPVEPSVMSIRQLMQEFKEGLRAGVISKQKYNRDVRTVILPDDLNSLKKLQQDLHHFDQTLRLTYKVYFDYLKRWVTMTSSSPLTQKNVLEQEWKFVELISSHVPSGKTTASVVFSNMASYMLHFTGQTLMEGIQDALQMVTEQPEDKNSYCKQDLLKFLRKVQQVVQDVRERTLRSSCFAKIICQDLEIASLFSVNVPYSQLFDRLQETNHVRLAIPGDSHYALFVPAFAKNYGEDILHLLDVTLPEEVLSYESEYLPWTAETHPSAEHKKVYMLMLHSEGELFSQLDQLWHGETTQLERLPSGQKIDFEHLNKKGLVLIVPNSVNLCEISREIQELFGDMLYVKRDYQASNRRISTAVNELKKEAVTLSDTILDSVAQFEEKSDFILRLNRGPAEQIFLMNCWREAVSQCYKYAFEYHKDIVRLVTGQVNRQAARNTNTLAHRWMKFVVNKCERGRGQRPRWATHGLDFLTVACEPRHTRYLNDEEFFQLKESIKECIAHVVGSPGVRPALSLSRSPSGAFNRRNRRSVDSRGSTGDDSEADRLSSCPPSPRPYSGRQLSLGTELRAPPTSGSLQETGKLGGWHDRVIRAVDRMESARQAELKEKSLIGHVSSRDPGSRRLIRARSVTFTWQRGVKIGQGRFGKVYVAVNNRTGELMAMKEISLQPNDYRAIRSVADELRIFEGIHHRNLVRHYGVEIHHEEMLIFMEYCPEGTLEAFVAASEGLPEDIVRRFTRQLLEAVSVLHENGIVHRDIKSANIFLTDGGSSLKLGDYGCAAKIRSNTTAVGELQGFVGTQAYMAPEVFTRSYSEGHGRAADIWSVGCVVIEMISGKRPWHEVESNYAIMFRVGMGETPAEPPNISNEGKDFLSRCLRHNPRERDPASLLLDHPFVKIYNDEQHVHHGH